jgi:hypothetical protein
MRRIVGEAHDEAVQLLSDNRHRLDGLAEELFQAETLEEPEAYTAAGLEPPSDDGTAAKKAGRGRRRADPRVSIPHARV